MPAPRRPGSAGSQQGARRWSGDPGLPLLPSPPFGYCNAFLGIFFPFFFLSASLELNDISSSAGAAGRLGDSERLEKQQRAAPGSTGKVRAILLENPLGFSITPAVGGGERGMFLETQQCFRARLAGRKFAELVFGDGDVPVSPAPALRYGAPGKAGLENCSQGRR